MPMEWIDVYSHDQMIDMIKDMPKAFVLLYKEGADASQCALQNLEALDLPQEGYVFLKADVSKVRDIHPHYNITTVPTLIYFENGQMKNAIKGCMTPEYYESLIKGIYVARGSDGEEKKQKRVIVYSTPSCPWCNRLKNYLREKNIRFEDVDVAANQSRAEEMKRKSGQMGVPQTDIEGQIVVGFDKPKINRLLGIN